MIDRLPYLFCGEFFDVDDLHYSDGFCKLCHRGRQERKGKAFYAFKKKHGYKPKSLKKRARKAQITRMANLSVSDPKRFERLMKKKPPRVQAQIKRKIKKLELL